MKNKIPYLQEWLDLASSGKFERAQELYFEKLFEAVINNFCNEYSNTLPSGGTLFSVLGFSPEPIILTAKAIQPETHIIFTTNNQKVDNSYLEKFLDSNYEIIYLNDESFESLYKAMKEQLVLNPDPQITVDITGGKKSMVASASIFSKDYGCRIVYVDFSDYIKDLRKPMPGSEILNVVYNPFKNQPEKYILNENQRIEFLDFHKKLIKTSFYVYDSKPTRNELFQTYIAYEMIKGLNAPVFPQNLILSFKKTHYINLEELKSNIIFYGKSKDSEFLIVGNSFFKCRLKADTIV